MEFVTVVIEQYGIIGLMFVLGGLGLYFANRQQNRMMDRMSETNLASHNADIEQQRTMTSMVVNTNQRVDEMQKTINENQKTITEQFSKILDLTEKLGDAVKAHEVLAAKYEGDQAVSAEKILRLEDATKRLENQNTELKNQLTAAVSERVRLRKEADEYRKERDEYRKERDEYRKQRDQLKGELEQANGQILELRTRIESVERRLDTKPLEPINEDIAKDKAA